MANAKDFVTHIIGIDGVAECLLIRNDGRLLARASADSKNYSSLMMASKDVISGIMKTSGFGNCRHLSFNRESERHFYIFPIDKYLLGVKQSADCSIPDMLKAIHALINRVSTGKSSVNQDRVNKDGG